MDNRLQKAAMKSKMGLPNIFYVVLFLFLTVTFLMNFTNIFRGSEWGALITYFPRLVIRETSNFLENLSPDFKRFLP
jgi:hypothetical protein